MNVVFLSMAQTTGNYTVAGSRHAIPVQLVQTAYMNGRPNTPQPYKETTSVIFSNCQHYVFCTGSMGSGNCMPSLHLWQVNRPLASFNTTPSEVRMCFQPLLDQPFPPVLVMEDSVEFRTVKMCTVPLKKALKGLDGNMVDVLYQHDFITDDVYDQVLNHVTLMSAADKAHELVKSIENRVKQDRRSYFMLVCSLTHGGVLYQPIFNKLTEEYQRQLCTYVCSYNYTNCRIDIGFKISRDKWIKCHGA